jgi:c-di-GMP-binding flagellar brake protein YcgR
MSGGITMRFEEMVRLGELFEVQYGDITIRTKLEEIVSETEIIVLQPTLRGVPVKADDQDVTFIFYRPTGCYRFSARIHPPYRKGKLILCRAERVSEVKKIQRRLCYRLPIVLDVYLYELDDVGEFLETRYKAKTNDLSEKSVSVSCFTKFEEETFLGVEIHLSKTEKVRLRAKVLQCHTPVQSTDPYDIVLIFTNQQEKDRSYIRRYIFNQQIQLRKKGIQ